MILKPVIVAVPQIAPPRSSAQILQQKEYARLALRQCARRCGAPVDGWEKDDHDVPLPNGGFCWSVSHKRQWAAAVISDQPVGIDIEHALPRPRELHDELAGAGEWAVLGDRSWQTFFKLWTAKEAVLKATGVGITGFSRCRLLHVGDDGRTSLRHNDMLWTIEHYHHADHVVAVTCNSAPVRWCVLKQAPEADKTETESSIADSRVGSAQDILGERHLADSLDAIPVHAERGRTLEDDRQRHRGAQPGRHDQASSLQAAQPRGHDAPTP